MRDDGSCRNALPPPQSCLRAGRRGRWSPAGIRHLALGGVTLSGDLGQHGLDLLLCCHFLGTYCVLRAVHGFSSLNITGIILQTHLAEGRAQADRCVQGTVLGAVRAGCGCFLGVKEAQSHAGRQGTRAGAGIGRQALCLSVSAVSTPALIPYGSSWALISPSVKWAPGRGQEECEGHLRLLCFEEGGAGWQRLALGSFVAQE